MSDKKLPVILTIDDEKPVRESFRNYLEDYDYEVLEAENGRVGLEVFERRNPDLVLVDLRMPEVDGLEVMTSITGSSPDTPIIVISGAGVISDVVEALHLGAWDYLLKPVEDLGVLKHAVETALERARLIRENRAYQEHLEEEVARRTQELEKTNEALRESEERFRFFSETSFEGIFLLEKGRVLDVNRRGAELFGYQLEEVIGKSALELTAPESRELVLTRIQSGYEKPYVALGLRKDGSIFAGVLHARNMTYKGRSVRVTVIRDITERKQAEQLQDAVYRIAQAADRSPRLDDLFPAIHEIIQDVMTAKNFYIALYDEKEDLLSFPFFVDEIDVPPPPTKPGKGLTEYILRTGKSLLCEMDLHEELESLGEVELVGTPSPIWLGVPLSIDNKAIGVMAVQHYTDAKAYGKREQRMLEFVSSQVAKAVDQIHSEEVLRESEERYRSLFENVPVGLYRTTPDGEILDGNRTLLEILGYPDREALLAINAAEVYSNPEDRQREQALLEHEGVIRGFEVQMRRRDGAVIWVRDTMHAFLDSEGQVVYYEGSMEDITEHKQAEEQIQYQLDNLAALHAIDTAITSGVDLNTTIQVVLEQITTCLKIDAADVLLFDEHTLMLEYAAGRGFRSASSRSKSLRIGSSYAGSVAIERKMLYILNILEDDNAPRIAKTLWLEEGLVTYFGVPLIIKGELKGILELFHRSQLEPDKDWLGFLDTLAKQTAIAIDNTNLFNDLHRTNLELELAYETTLEGWASALELRDYETKGHSTRVVSMTMHMSERLGFSGEELVSLRRGALLHDIGKMGVPDSILLKPGPLTDSEWELMKRHPLHGYEMLKSITFLKPSLDIVLSHHERWDGAGYPNGTKGKDIPLPARIFAIVDVWDSLTSDRPYRKAWSREKALAYIQEQSGTHFDPSVVEAFLYIQELLLTS